MDTMTNSATAVIAGACVWLSMIASLSLWAGLLERWWRGEPALQRVLGERRERPIWAVAAAVGWTCLSLWDRVLAELRATPPTPTTDLVGLALLMSLGVFAVLLLFLLGDGQFPWREIGIDWSRFAESCRIGVAGVIAAVLPTGLILLATLPLRSAETQHSLLRLLFETADARVLALLACTAIVVAPLSEELLFRVILQGWLTRHWGATPAIALVSLTFAAVHGWRDGVALIPLAIILGYIYDRRHDYVAVVVTHGLFNAANLILALMSAPTADVIEAVATAPR